VGAVLGIGWGFVAFPMFDTANDFVVLIAVILGLAIHALMYAGQPALMSEMFPTRMRYSGVSLGYQVTSIVAGSLAPIIASWLLRETGSSVPISIYLAITCVITLVAVVSLRETKGIDLESIDAEDRRRLAEERAARV
jgi:MFS family permease